MDGKVKQRIVKRLGELSELVASDPDILAKLKAEAERLTKEQSQHSLTLELDVLDANDNEPFLNYGYFFLEALYKRLEIDSFVKGHEKSHRYSYSLDEVLKLLVFSRILNPCSKDATRMWQSELFGNWKIKKDHIYRALDHIGDMTDDLQPYIHKRIEKYYGRQTTLVFYDVTNYYFTTDTRDELRKVGYSKENRKTPIVQMGLFMDDKSIPICYRLFEGNTSDVKTLTQFIDESQEIFGFSKIIVVADKAMNSKENIHELTKRGHGWIFSQKLRGNVSKSLVDFALDDNGYRDTLDSDKNLVFRHKSMLTKRDITMPKDSIKHEIDQKVLIKWSEKYEKRERLRREDAIKWARELIDHPGRYSSSNKRGGKRYIAQETVSTTTGEIDADVSQVLRLNEKQIQNDEKLDGFYALVTSETNLDDDTIMAQYSQLWHIEESFRISKTDLKTRPVFVWTKKHIEAHFLTCFIALVIARLLQHQMGSEYSVATLATALKKMTCRHLKDGCYILQRPELATEIEEAFNVSLDRKYALINELNAHRGDISKNLKYTTKIMA